MKTQLPTILPTDAMEAASGESLAPTRRLPKPRVNASAPPALPTNYDSDPTVHPSGGWLELRILAEMVADHIEHRIATGNRIGIGREAPMFEPLDVATYMPHYEALVETEERLKKQLAKCFKRVVPAELVAWQEESPGLGPNYVGRLLGHLGDPYVAIPHRWEGTGEDRTLMVGEPYVRTIAQLWQFCGHGDPTRRHKVKGISAEELAAAGSPTLKMLVHLNAESCMKQKSGTRYRDIYEAARLKYEDRVHAVPCVRCGPSGRPAGEGTPWKKGHQMAAALRVVGKELLRDMWLLRHHAVTETRGDTTPTRESSRSSTAIDHVVHDPHGVAVDGTLPTETTVTTSPNNRASRFAIDHAASVNQRTAVDGASEVAA